MLACALRLGQVPAFAVKTGGLEPLTVILAGSKTYNVTYGVPELRKKGDEDEDDVVSVGRPTAQIRAFDNPFDDTEVKKPPF